MRRALALAAVSAAVLPAAALPATAAAKPTITLSGSTTVAPLAALLIKKYLRVCNHCAKFKLLQGGSNIGVSDVAHGRVSIGDSSRDPQSTDPGGLVFHPIARDAICLITNNANTIANLSQTDVQTIFDGGARSWTQVNGAAITGTIDLYTRNAASGTHDAFAKLIMGSHGVASFAAQYSSNGLVEQSVARDPHGIGYVSLHFANDVHPVAYEGVACTFATPSPVSTRRSATCTWSLAATRSGRCTSSSTGSAPAALPTRSSPATGCRCTNHAK